MSDQMIIKIPFHGSSSNASRTLKKFNTCFESWSPFSLYFLKGCWLSYTEEMIKTDAQEQI